MLKHMTKKDLVDAMDNVPDYADGMFIGGWEPKND